MLRKNIETFLCCDREWEEAGTVLFGAPFDSTTSYRPGSRFGSAAIRRESYGIESYSPYQDKDLLDSACSTAAISSCPSGTRPWPWPRLKSGPPPFYRRASGPSCWGGEHLVTLGAFRAAFSKYPDIHILHFDAHADLREDYLGVGLSHACVLRRCWELCGDGKIFQFGIRSGDREEFRWGASHVNTHKFDLHGLEERLEQLGDTPVYFTLDLDVLDPSVFPGTGTPEPGGVAFEELRKAVTLVCQKANVVACDVNELSPPYDQSGVSTMVACKIVREMLLALD